VAVRLQRFGTSGGCCCVRCGVCRSWGLRDESATRRAKRPEKQRGRRREEWHEKRREEWGVRKISMKSGVPHRLGKRHALPRRVSVARGGPHDMAKPVVPDLAPAIGHAGGGRPTCQDNDEARIGAPRQQG
jgi:hypothetical protein